MRLATVGKTFTFHAAHRLPNHNGKCRNLHGHTYTLEVTVTKPIVPVDPDSPSTAEGMVVDFQLLKDIYKEMVEPQVDHRYLNETLDMLVPNTWDPENDAVTPLTTCEHIAMWIWRVYTDFLTGEALLIGTEDFVRIKLWETPTSYAVVPAERNGVDHA